MGTIDDSQGPPEKPNPALGNFLRSRRARLAPEKAGVHAGRRRRVQGLRRKEVASLAGLSTDYYTRLEQGRHAGASPTVLNAIATALQLSEEEHLYLQLLAAPQGEEPVEVPMPRPETGLLLRTLEPAPGLLLGPGMDVLQANTAAKRLYTDFDALPAGRRNAVDWMLSDPAARAVHGDDWPVIAAEMIGMLRLRSIGMLNNSRVHNIVTRLTASYPFFREVWEAQRVSLASRRVKRFLIPEVGPVEMAVESLNVDQPKGLLVVALIPKPGSPDERAWLTQ